MGIKRNLIQIEYEEVSLIGSTTAIEKYSHKPEHKTIICYPCLDKNFLCKNSYIC